jgi:hypothetical protein
MSIMSKNSGACIPTALAKGSAIVEFIEKIIEIEFNKIHSNPLLNSKLLFRINIIPKIRQKSEVVKQNKFIIAPLVCLVE